MNADESKTLKPGMRVRVTATPKNWFFSVGDEAVLVQLDTDDNYGDWIAKFDNGCHWYLEPHLNVDFEVI